MRAGLPCGVFSAPDHAEGEFFSAAAENND
jgi:hypothetical protein